ncbi:MULTISPECIES: 16S rRNA (cytosine(967)-C(5))-methyltransferase RsmB [unclassified Ruminococcus]|uniref:16S rRNA (cytosine(967)-C(5))-methyltransferase RsmB n=1 Tax=unclassified Ruminococcus TaxID=2608920 RepID=UPI002108F4EE|nr:MULTISPECIES: 16S rRNA (cytosine(967)-C(5))-methyltransferase RsmB [unclassified Ruminococcus]MCQ4022590.1 16S rRNA (cytosine(967)-C(5))-methyltransferase RsmB [Ruminococcus sp. zg-924]MCQ4114830.1 16S rRNA (cytosine(967)-C(5))-methyltransferase RsmB [Ruminococcus sp. zg-921]
MGNSRKTSFKALYNVLYNDAYSNIEINRAIKASQLDRRDAALASAIFYGVLERRLTLDKIIRQYSTIPLRKIEDKVLILLEQALYQILYFDKIPDSAAVNEAVKLCKSLRLNKSAGFINGVLRSFLRANKAYNTPDIANNRLDSLSFTYSCPVEIIKILDSSYGEKLTEDILKSLFGRPPVTAAVNTLKATPVELIESLLKQGVKAQLSNLANNSVELSDTGSIEEIESFRQGLFYVQDEASQIAIELLNPQAGETIIDVCSAPGGKSFKSAVLMKNKGKIYSYDLHPHKVELIKKTAKRLGINIINSAVRDALSDSKNELADKVICDVPCSGLGVIRRKPEIRYKNTDNFSALPPLQYKILIKSSQLVKKGGVLLYSTCTLNKAENNDISDKFLKENEGFKPLKLKLPKTIKRVIPENDNCLTLLPSEHNTDGFFVSAFVRCE